MKGLTSSHTKQALMILHQNLHCSNLPSRRQCSGLMMIHHRYYNYYCSICCSNCLQMQVQQLGKAPERAGTDREGNGCSFVMESYFADIVRKTLLRSKCERLL